MALQNLAQYANAATSKVNYYTHRKSGGLADAVGVHYDTSMIAGRPRFNAYPGGLLESTQLVGGANNGIYTGPPLTAGQERYVLKAMAMQDGDGTQGLQHFYYCDYLMFYPLVDLISDERQEFVNTVNLPRYVDGDGVRVFGVYTSSNTVGSISSVLEYVDADGVDQTQTITIAIGQTGHLCSTAGTAATRTFFFPLSNKGVRSLTAITNLGSAEGFMSLVLCKPLFQIVGEEFRVPTEITFGRDHPLVKIEDGAYINALCARRGGSSNRFVIFFNELQFVTANI